MPHSEKSNLGINSEKPREWRLKKYGDSWMQIRSPGPSGWEGEDIRVVEVEPVERELAQVRERAEKAEAERDSALEAYRVLDLQHARLKGGIREATMFVENARFRDERAMRSAPGLLRDIHVAAESWLAAYCPIPEEDQ